MPPPPTHRAFRRRPGKQAGGIEMSSGTTTKPGPLAATEVLLKIHAVSINYRDVAMLHGKYPVEVLNQGIATSDCAAEVVELGSKVVDFAVGDHVSVIFNLAVIKGDEDTPSRALGGDSEGVLREYAVFDQEYLVHLPKSLRWDEASTITCAGVTAWTALNATASGPKGRFALLQGTGGVSMFALLLCIAANITPIITSSSNAKLQSITETFSASASGSATKIMTINYKETQDIAAEVMRLTYGLGVDVVVNNIGVTSIPADIAALRKRNGTISMVGFLGGLDAEWSPKVLMGLMGKTAFLKGIGVGSRADFQNLCRFIDDKGISLAPLLDRTFAFEQSNEAFEYVWSGQHIGKVIIQVSS